MSPASETLAAFAAALEFEMLPADVVRVAKLHLIDLLGVALAAAGTEFGAKALELGRALSASGSCTVLGASQGLAGVWAAFVNGTLGHALDYDDTHAESVVHVSTSVVPAALAVCEERGADGRTFLTALALGMEANIRLGLVAPGEFHDRGFHPTGICGTFASGLLAGKVAGLGQQALANTLGLAGSQAAGSLEFLTDGSWAKRIHGGWAAHCGLVAARAAAAGFTGPRGVFEGRFGLYRSHFGENGWDVSRLTVGLGERWHLLDTSLKPYPCCHYNHAFIDCAQELRRAHALTAEMIDQVTCSIAAREVPIVCEPQATKRRPQTDYDAKFSLPYAVASMLVRGHVDVDDFTGEAIRDSAVLSLSERVSYQINPTAEFPRRFSGGLRMRLRDGRQLQHDEPINRGSAERPLSDAEVYAKFRRNACRALAPAGADAVLTAVERLERASDLSGLTESLRASLL